MKQYIVGLGEALWDCLPEAVKRLAEHLQTSLSTWGNSDIILSPSVPLETTN